MLPNIPRSWLGPRAKVTKSETTVGRTPTSRRCRRKMCGVSCNELTMQSRTLQASVPHCFDRHTDRLQNGKNDGYTMNSDTTLFFGMLTRWTGNDPVRRVNI